jgi:hypothetical protein
LEKNGDGERRESKEQDDWKGVAHALIDKSTHPGALLNRFEAFFPPLPEARGAPPCRLFFPPDAR